MKLITLQKNLRQAVFSVNHVTSKNTALPILNNIMISAKGGSCSLVSTNLEIGITSILRCKVEEEGSYTVDAKLLSEYVVLMDNDKVEIKQDGDELIISCGQAKTKIKGTSSEEFPFIPEIKKENEIKINPQEFSQAIDQVIFATAQNENKPELSGVLMVIDEKNITLVGTDSYRLSERKVLINNKNKINTRLIIPTKTLQEVVRIASLGQSEEIKEVSLYINDSQCLFVIGEVEVVSRVIDGRYPEYSSIIPDKHLTKIEVSTKELIRLIKAASIFAKTNINDIILIVSKEKNTIAISSTSGQLGEFEASLKGVVNGEDNDITLNYRYLIDVLNSITTEGVSLSVVNKDTPCVIKEVGGSEYTHLIMPIRK